MQLKISAWSIRNPIPVSLLFIILMIAGALGYGALPVKLYPDVSFPIIQVSVALPGAAAGDVEKQVTREVESAVSNIAGINHVRSTVTEGLSTTRVEFEIGDDPRSATDEVRGVIDEIRNDLPQEIEEPIVERLDFDSAPTVTYSVSSDDLSDVELSWLIDDTIARRLVAEDGVAEVRRLGGVEREINVTIDPDRLEARGLTAPQINDALRGTAIDVPGGRSQIGGREQNVRVLGASPTVDRLAATAIPTPGGTDVTLGSVATVSDGAGERRGFAQLDGNQVVGFQVMKTSEASDVAVARQVASSIEDIAAENPGLHFSRIVSSADSTQNSFTATLHALIEGMILAAIIVFFFLWNWRATLIAAAAMPISLIPTFWAMNLMGFSLNTITLLALTLVIGILVDDAIVEIENIQKRVEAGQTPYEAALHGADEIGLAVMATTATIIVVFVPVSLMGGYAGQFFKEFGFTVAVSVAFSLLVARMLTPLMAAYLIKPVSDAHEREPFEGLYARSLKFALAHRWLSLGAGVLFFAGSLGLAATIPTGFTPPPDNGIINLTMKGAPGTTLADMQRGSARLSRELLEQADVDSVFVSVGASDIRTGAVTVVLDHDRSGTTQDVQRAIRPLLAQIPDMRVSIAAPVAGGGGSTTVEVPLGSEDPDLLARTTLELQRQMRGLDEITDVQDVTPQPAGELIITPKPLAAARLGVTADTLGSIARVATVGDVDAKTAKFDEGQQRVPVRVRLPDSARGDLATIRNLRVPTASGASVPLDAVADIGFAAGATQIDRFDRQRRAVIEAQLDGASLGEANAAIDKLPIMENLPAGVTRLSYGQSENMKELFTGFAGAMVAGIALIFAVLVLLFGSFFKPITILAALPLSLSGAFIGLIVGGSELDLPALIGLLMLMGLAAKNSILLVEFAIEAERDGRSHHDAIIEACRERARPIVMTTIAMAAGMVPTALGLGEGSEIRVPMAMAVIGGLISSTLLSLVIVPVVYELVNDLERWAMPRFARLVVRREGAQARAGNESPGAA